jgi:hypothetical protein
MAVASAVTAITALLGLVTGGKPRLPVSASRP